MDDNRKALALYRIEKAEKCLRAAKHARENEDFETAANRSYYYVPLYSRFVSPGRS